MMMLTQAMENDRNANAISNCGDVVSRCIRASGNRDMATMRKKKVRRVMTRGVAWDFCAEKFSYGECQKNWEFSMMRDAKEMCI
jgi:hypothetical protein